MLKIYKNIILLKLRLIINNIKGLIVKLKIFKIYRITKIFFIPPQRRYEAKILNIDTRKKGIFNYNSCSK